MSMPGPLELVVIFAIVLLVFGPKQIVNIAKGMGEGVREFKKALTDSGDERKV